VIDLHCHILPGIDDGAADMDVSVAMARAFVADGVTTVACTPHILPGVYNNTGPGILTAIETLQLALTLAGVPLTLVSGADVHLVPNMAGGLKSGALLSLAGTRYVLVEPPHHVMPPRLENAFFDLLSSGYVPILTHPERLTWIKDHYDTVCKLATNGVLLQVTGGSLTGAFGKSARYWADRLLDEGRVHILATDSHDVTRRPPELSRARDYVAKKFGDREAVKMVLLRPRGVLQNALPSELDLLTSGASVDVAAEHRDETGHWTEPDGGGGPRTGIAGRLRRYFR
jgi:protein-tyrosine phosphatase